MMEGGKYAIRKTGDQLGYGKMQFQKEQANVSGENDYVNMETKAANVQEAMGSKSRDELTTRTNNIVMPYDKGEKSIGKEE